ncbi:hypothetical protein COF68_04435 [Bacillus toyonensis]|uniref:hypothetical protein n=1 Tax=Bacillus toyonensis TaxID=155322 RepID=UPI000BFD7367|nr:hypothetical protein [Bacillus toyonensis]PHE64103.1 hypothetical protein COF68_04435 [Bacillus toyonensis]
MNPKEDSIIKDLGLEPLFVTKEEVDKSRFVIKLKPKNNEEDSKVWSHNKKILDSELRKLRGAKTGIGSISHFPLSPYLKEVNLDIDKINQYKKEIEEFPREIIESLELLRSGKKLKPLFKSIAGLTFNLKPSFDVDKDKVNSYGFKTNEEYVPSDSFMINAMFERTEDGVLEVELGENFNNVTYKLTYDDFLQYKEMKRKKEKLAKLEQVLIDLGLSFTSITEDKILLPINYHTKDFIKFDIGYSLLRLTLSMLDNTHSLASNKKELRVNHRQITGNFISSNMIYLTKAHSVDITDLSFNKDMIELTILCSSIKITGVLSELLGDSNLNSIFEKENYYKNNYYIGLDIDHNIGNKSVEYAEWYCFLYGKRFKWLQERFINTNKDFLGHRLYTLD